MKFAMINNKREEAKPNKRGLCSVCNETLISKCGNIKVWHWAHTKGNDCDDWYEPESLWHRSWKNYVPKEKQEVVIGNHRADILTNNNLVVELQNSSISSEDIILREKFYGNMIWLVNAKTIGKGIIINKKKEGFLTFRWRYPPKSWWYAEKQIYVDLGEKFSGNIFLIKKIYKNTPCRGWGVLLSKNEFIQKVLK